MVYIYVILLSMVIVSLRIVKGPTFADRLVAMGPLTLILVFLMCLNSLQTGTSFYLGIALLLALLSFVGTLAIAKGVNER